MTCFCSILQHFTCYQWIIIFAIEIWYKSTSRGKFKMEKLYMRTLSYPERHLMLFTSIMDTQAEIYFELISSKLKKFI